MIGYQVDEGRHGDVRLDGLKAALIVSRPGPVHEGNGTMQVVIEERADARQPGSLHKIIHGEDTKDMATHRPTIRPIGNGLTWAIGSAESRLARLQ